MLLVLAGVTGLAWWHSHFAGYQWTWSDSGRQVCGRFASRRGLVLWQRCDLAQSPPLPSPMSSWPVVMPGDFVVGTNPAGERAVVTCADLAVPFAFPKQGAFVVVQNQITASTDGASQARWYARWSEIAVAYWLILVLLLLGPAAIAVCRFAKRIKLKREHSQVGEPTEPNRRPVP